MRRVLILTVAMAVMLALAVPAGATPPSGVQFGVETSLSGGGPFVANGPAVDDGVICEMGDVSQVFFKGSGFQSERAVNFQIIDQFTCDDGSGDFLVKLQVRLVFGVPATFSWTVIGGTGDYSDLHGTGTGVGLPDECGELCIFDVYDGRLHND